MEIWMNKYTHSKSSYKNNISRTNSIEYLIEVLKYA